MTNRPRLWRCQTCERAFANRNQSHACGRFTLAHHFRGKPPAIRALFRGVVAAIRSIGPVRILPEKTRIAFQVRMSFAQVTPRRGWLDGHVILARRLDHPRFRQVQTFSPRNHLHTFRLAQLGDIDAEFRAWLAEAYLVGAQQHLKARNRAERELVSTRVFDSPRDLVYAAVSDPVALAAWWGPQGFSNTFQEFDLRPGGVWRFVMHAPDGSDFDNESVFLEAVAPERIVFRHLRPMHEYQMTMLLSEESGRTHLTWRMLFESVAECQRVRPFIVPANEQNFDRLQAHLQKVFWRNKA